MWGQSASAVRPGKARLFLSTGNSLESHFLSWTLRLPPPFGKQRRIILRDVLLPLHSQLLRRCINPPRRTFNLAEVADRRLIHHYIACLILPLRAKFFIAKRRTIPK